MALSPLTLVVLLTVVSQSLGEKMYDVIPEKTEIFSFDPAWLNIVTLEVSKYNRTRYCINVEAEILQDLPEDLICYLDSYEKYGTRYGKSALSIPEKNCCEFMASDTLFMPSLREYDFIDKCPITKGTYKLFQWYPDMSGFPDQLPGEYWRVDVSVKTSAGDVILKVGLYAKIDSTKAFKLG